MKDQNIYSYKTTEGISHGFFNIYQARNGKIFLMMGNVYTELSYKQINELSIDLYRLIDFDLDDLIAAYDIQIMETGKFTNKR